MKKIFKIFVNVISVIIIVLTIYYFITGKSFLGVQSLLISAMMALLAYNHIQSNKERKIKKFNITVCLHIFAGYYLYWQLFLVCSLLKVRDFLILIDVKKLNAPWMLWGVGIGGNKWGRAQGNQNLYYLGHIGLDTRYPSE